MALRRIFGARPARLRRMIAQYSSKGGGGDAPTKARVGRELTYIDERVSAPDTAPALRRPEAEKAHGGHIRTRWLSRDVNFDAERWALHKSSMRHLRHLLMLRKSTALRRLLVPDLLILGAWSSGLTWYNCELAVIDNLPLLTMPAMPLTMSAVALGLLATFRTNASYNRFVEARTHWGAIINTSRDLTRQALRWVAGHPPTEDARARTARIVCLVKSFPIALNYHLTEHGGHYDAIDRAPAHRFRGTDGGAEAVLAALRHELGTVWAADPDARGRAAVDRLMESGHRPLHVLQRLSEELGAAARDGGLDPVLERELDHRVCALTDALGACERIRNTPIPTTYTRHTSRFLTLWCNLLPLALFPALGWGTPGACLFIGYALLGIEDIGVQIEEPFDVLPLWQYSAAVAASCDALVAQKEASLS